MCVCCAGLWGHSGSWVGGAVNTHQVPTLCRIGLGASATLRSASQACDVWSRPQPRSFNSRAAVFLLFWNLCPVVVLLLFLLSFMTKILISVVKCHFFGFLEAVLGQRPSEQRTTVSGDVCSSTCPLQPVSSPQPLNGFQV